MKRIIIAFALLCMYSISYAQVGINTIDLDATAILKIGGDQEGIMIPRVALTGIYDTSSITSPATGLLIYNTTSNNNITEGYHYFNGTFWEIMHSTKNRYPYAKYTNTNTSTDVNTQMLAPIFSTEQNNDNNSIYQKISATRLRVKQSGRYEISINFFLESNVDDVQPIGRIELNGTPTGAVFSSGHIKTDSGHNNTSLNLHETINISANQVITIQMDSDKSNITTFDSVGTSSFTITKVR